MSESSRAESWRPAETSSTPREENLLVTGTAKQLLTSAMDASSTWSNKQTLLSTRMHNFFNSLSFLYDP